MSKKKLKERKKQQKKAKAKARVVSRRNHIRRLDKEIHEETKAKQHFEDRIFPIRKAPKEAVVLDNAQKDEYVKRRLENNMKILEALEKDIEEEDRIRNNINNNLEEKGLNTVKEKMDFIFEQSQLNQLNNDQIPTDLN